MRSLAVSVCLSWFLWCSRSKKTLPVHLDRVEPHLLVLCGLDCEYGGFIVHVCSVTSLLLPEHNVSYPPFSLVIPSFCPSSLTPSVPFPLTIYHLEFQRALILPKSDWSLKFSLFFMIASHALRVVWLIYE